MIVSRNTPYGPFGEPPRPKSKLVESVPTMVVGVVIFMDNTNPARSAGWLSFVGVGAGIDVLLGGYVVHRLKPGGSEPPASAQEPVASVSGPS
jgi:hypothetical protein